MMEADSAHREQKNLEDEGEFEMNEENKCSLHISDAICRTCKQQVNFFFGVVSCSTCNWEYDILSRPTIELDALASCKCGLGKFERGLIEVLK